MSIDQGGFYPIAIHKKLLTAISPKVGNFVRVIKGLHDHICASADVIASDCSRKTKRPADLYEMLLPEDSQYCNMIKGSYPLFCSLLLSEQSKWDLKLSPFLLFKNVPQTSDKLNRDLEKAPLWAWQ